jgi:hypothetical protein
MENERDQEVWNKCYSMAHEGIGRSSDGVIKNFSQRVNDFTKELYLEEMDKQK